MPIHPLAEALRKVLETFADQRCSGCEELLALQEAEAALRAWDEAQRVIPAHLQPENRDA